MFYYKERTHSFDRRLTADCLPDQLPLPFLEAVPVSEKAVGQPQPSVCGKVKGHLWESALSFHPVHSVCTAGIRLRCLAWQKRLHLLSHLAALPNHFSLLK